MRVKILAALLIACMAVAYVRADAASVPTPKTAEQGCGDFLAQMGEKPGHVTYAGCSYMADRQGKPLQAVYHVPGRFAAATEAYFVRKTGLRRLKRSCCQWDGPPDWFRDSSGREISITMVSEETVVARRSDWRRIGTFEIIVEVFTEDI